MIAFQIIQTAPLSFMTATTQANPERPTDKWQFWIDRGGTFTDIVARSPEGQIKSHKLLSENPERYRDAAIQGIKELLGIDANAPIPAGLIEHIKMGTTVATNALLEHQGAPTLLLITRGFGDALRIAYQNRPRLFDLEIKLPEQLYQSVIEVDERIGAQGDIVTPLRTAGLLEQLHAARQQGIDSVAIVLMHGYRYPQHEQALAELCQAAGFNQISLSHQVSPLMKLVSRGDTTVVDAYLSPILQRYVDQVATELGDTPLMFMQSNGGLIDARLFRGKDSILSGPAGGIIGAIKTSEQAGCNKIIGFDMGGTSTDVSHYAGQYQRTGNAMVAGFRIQAPMLQIHTVAAGGGSILSFDGARFRVGPESAGANPGPACYRRGGPLTVTDCNVMLGKLQPDYFPAVFGPGGNLPLDQDIVINKFTELAAEINQQTGQQMTPQQVAEGFLTIAVDNMANAIKQISTQRGHDVTDYSLCCFGGAGGQHACLVADALGIKRVIIHPLGGVLSAYGMGLAEQRSIRQQSLEGNFAEWSGSIRLEQCVADLTEQARAELIDQGIEPAMIECLTTANLKYAGTDSPLPVPLGSPAETLAAFEQDHRTLYGFVTSDQPIVIESISVEAVARQPMLDISLLTDSRSHPSALAEVSAYFADEAHRVPVWQRDSLALNQHVTGPAIISETTGTTIIEPGWQATLSPLGNLELTRVAVDVPAGTRAGNLVSTTADPIMLEVFNNLFMSIAEQMGLTLEKTSRSVNVKERLDFSCAIFDPHGELVANAPHMPVHLGSMGESVKAIIAGNDHIEPGDVYVTNAPYNGGTHLPDITVITPVFDRTESTLLFYVASRGHHADIGGISPGSMPPNSTEVAQEGILLDNIRLVKQGEFQEQHIRTLLSTGRWPARNPEQNIADLKAQIAANTKGTQEMWRMIEQFGIEVVQAYMQHVQDNAEEAVRQVIASLQDGHFELNLDDGSCIKVAIRIDRTHRKVAVDFTGTSEQRPNNFNAPLAVCKAAVLYVFRTLVHDDIPMNQGCLKPLDIIVPEGCMLNPAYPAAVVAGNVETSQWIVNALYGALGVMAAAQGTMNNFTFGNDQYQYYETICGGTGAGADFDGCDAVQSHMTNSRLTDPEVLEWRYPVRVESFAIREKSGGQGKHSGGNGVIRKIRFLEQMTAAILSSHRQQTPFGIAGGHPGKSGVNRVERRNGEVEPLAATAQPQIAAGDIFVVETPGGGGFGQT